MDTINGYQTVADRREKFLSGEWSEKFKKLGYSIRKKIHWIEPGKEVMVEAMLYEKNEDGEWVFVSNAFAFESREFSDFNKVNFLENAETSAVGRLLVEIGIGKGPSMEEMQFQAKKMAVTKAASRKKKREISTKDTLQRLKLEYIETDDGFYKVKLSSMSEKQIEVLKRYGFVEDGENLIAKIDKGDK